MELTQYFKSVLEMDRSPIVLCNLEHKIMYMNPTAAKRYESSGGYKMLGGSVLDCHGPYGKEKLLEVVEWFKADTANNIIYESRNEKEYKDVYMVALREDDGTLIGYYEKHEYRTNDTAKPYDYEAGSL